MKDKPLLELLFEERSLMDMMAVLDNEELYSTSEYPDNELVAKYYKLKFRLDDVRKEIKAYFERLEAIR